MLKIRIKPEGKLFFSGRGWIKNVGNRPMDVLVSDNTPVSRSSEEHLEEMIKKVGKL